jgi:hypothetical protein
MHPTVIRRAATLALLAPALMAVLNIASLWTQLHNPADTSTPESLLVYCAQRIQHGASLYQDYHRVPYNYMPYTPLYTEITGTAARWLNSDASGLFFLGRFLTFTCCLGVAFLLYKQGREGSDSFLCGSAGAAFFLASTILRQWAVTCRPDMLALLFSIAGFLMYTRFADKPARLFSLILFALAFLSKQSSVCAPVAIVLSQVLNRRYREALIIALGVAVPVATFMIAMHTATAGLSTLNIVENNAAPMQWINAKLIGMLFLQAAALPLILAIAGAGEKGEKDPGTCYLVTSLLFAVISSSKLGSNINYYLEPLAAACLLVPAGIRFAMDTPKGGVLFVALILVLSIPPLSIIAYSLQNPGFRAEQNIRKLAQGADGPLLTDNPRLAFLSRQQFLIDPFPFGYLERQGRWDSKEPVSMLDQHRIPLVILTLPVEDSLSWQGAKRLPLPIIDAVKRNYTLQQKLDGYYVYTPR